MPLGGHRGDVRIAYVTESFPPDVNGVANTAMRVAEHVLNRGHDLLVIAPRPARNRPAPDPGFPVARTPSVPLPVYPGLRIGVPWPGLRDTIERFRPDVVHLAGPFLLGAAAGQVADRLALPTVAVYATDMPAYARMYHAGPVGEAACWRRLRRIHDSVGRTLAPSTAVVTQLRRRGFARVWLWSRGVDTARFRPDRRDRALRATLAPGGEVIVGYVGRLAQEKRLDLLGEVARLPGVRLVIVGAGPAEAAARRALPGAVFLGQRQGADLARTYASLDIFVHAGPHDTFGNTLQEAAASGLPVVAPAAGGPLDLVADGVTGFLVQPGDATALTRAVAKLAADPELRARQGLAARTATSGRTWQRRCDELVGHYQAVAGAGPVAPGGVRPRTVTAEGGTGRIEGAAAGRPTAGVRG